MIPDNGADICFYECTPVNSDCGGWRKLAWVLESIPRRRDGGTVCAIHGFKTQPFADDRVDRIIRQSKGFSF